ncbi:carbon-nitrogen hydrolase [Endogone sp. FLAS-F59071]|nr:carbon-nitrogen hydrolase [Endogone sp. FLAS-F59071]|eukprot:RUS19295.1 carbon-nitrogen hydrolase [Endogone sp. FLAS-F59071]
MSGIVSIFISHPHYTFLTIIFFLTAYGIGINSIQILPIFLLSALKIYIDRGVARRDWYTLFVIPVLALGTAYAFYDPASPVNPLESSLALALLGGIFSTVAVITVGVAVVVARTLPDSQFTWASFFVFPAVWSLGWMAAGRTSPLGRWGDWTQESSGIVDPFLQIASYFGLPGVDFLMALLAAVIVVWAERLMVEDEDMESLHGISSYDYGAVSSEHVVENAEEPLVPRDKHLLRSKPVFGHAPFYSALFLVAVVFAGSARLATVQQTNDKMQVTSLACILRPPLTNSSNPLTNSSKQDPIDDMFTETSRYSNHAKLLLWSESAVTITRQRDLDQVFEIAKNYSRLQHIYLGITYLILADDNSRKYKNMLTMFDPKGEVLFEYEKTHPVPFAESFTVKAGPGLLPLEPVSFPIPKKNRRQDPITVSAAICLDMDFPGLLSQASSAQLVLSPAQTWSPAIGRVHFNMARVRAIEQGFAVLRCDSGGVSGFVDEFGRIKYYQEADYAGGTSRSFVVNWKPGYKVDTWYGVVGDWGAAGAIVGLVGFAWVVDRNLKKVTAVEV